jgi:NAD+ synthase (glutamine-hydrolysing)
MRILAAQLNPIIGDLAGNTKKIITTLDRARELKVDLVLYPELAICGYPPQDLLLHDAFIEEMQQCLKEIECATVGMSAVVGLARRNMQGGEKPLLNSAAILADGELLGFQDKMLLPIYDVFDERRYFEPGVYMQPWSIRGRKVGVAICEDIWQHAGYTGGTRYRVDPILELQSYGVDLLLNLSASPYQFQKLGMRLNVCGKAARTLGSPLILSAQVGANDQLVFDGYSLHVDKKGHLCTLAKGFEEDYMIVDLPLGEADEIDARRSCAPIEIDINPIEDLYRALVLGVRDYFRKSGFCRACLGLSGGVDSALVAAIAVDALGKENVLCLHLPSRYSSLQSAVDATALAERLGVEYISLPIEGPFDAYLDLLPPLFAARQPPLGQAVAVPTCVASSSVTEENLQSRIRGMILMALSNYSGCIVLSTGNKSENALGYCTLYGDMAGGLAVISDVTKKQVYELCHWINRNEEIIPLNILVRAPSAELRPDQKDADSLPPYDVIDAVVQGYVEDYLDPEGIAEKYSLELELVRELIRKIHRAEYKRRQAPPGIRVSRKSFRVGRQYPIVQKWIE